MMFKKWFAKSPQATTSSAPEIMGLRLGGAFELDPLKLRLIESDLIVEGVAKTHLIQAVGEIKLDEGSSALRFYTDDDGYLQVLLEGGTSENHVSDVKLWYFYETKGVGTSADWDNLLKTGISQQEKTIEGQVFKRVWSGVGEQSPPVAMTELTYLEDGSVSETDQFAMLYERQIKSEFFEYLMVSGEEKLIENKLDRCVVTSTGFDIQPADIEIIG